MPQALRMKENEIIEHAGLDSAAFLKIYVLGIKIFGPTAIMAFLVLIPVNVSGGMLFFLSKDLVISDIDKLSISNVQPKSPKFFAHILMMYVFTLWTCYMLYKEYDVVASMRLKFLASKSRRAEQFTVLVRNVPRVPDRSISDTVDDYFKKNHSNRYLCHESVYNANKPVIEVKFIKSFLQGFLPGLALKIFLWLLPGLLMTMSKLEGHVAFSVLERRTAGKYYFFMLVNVFLGSIVTGTAFEQLDSFLHQPPTQIPRTIGVSIPMKATFFITYIMVDGWAGMAGEILRLKPLIMFHLKNMLIVKTERDREKAMNPKSIDFPEAIPSLQLYFLMGAVYAVVTPILLPFILIFFAFAYFVYRHQVINVYNQRYESAAAFWPHVHTRILASLLISQILLLGLLSTKKAANSTPLLVVLPVLTITFHKYCKHRFEPAFRKYPLEEAVEKDTQDEASESETNLKSYLCEAYLHPVLRSFEEIELVEVNNRAHIPSQLATEPVSASHSHEASPNVQHLEVVVEQHEVVYKKH
ncbi:hypothetical protein L6452_25798 [Arctium lappa]|uniref:Uncharacterized protein n=2 Tax=Arctium lappa TaxID=4217 RepID=A0ACB9ABZ1_ARCLA|nr:hypothetical protein L6452_25795 [Arctium lappa]KAI3707356.1 hypothetical protein L6452_25798 [Arctium lappa]